MFHTKLKLWLILIVILLISSLSVKADILNVGQLGVGSYSSMAIVNGFPAIAYYDTSNLDLKFVRATDASGLTWGTSVIVDSTGNIGEFPSLTIVNGNPAISYYDRTNQDLKYVQASNSNGTAWNTPVTVDSTGNVGRYNSIVVANGNPAIAYTDDTNTNLKYVQASDSDGATWNTPITVDNSAGNVGSYTSIAIVNGNPAITHNDFTSGTLVYVRASDADGTAWNTPIVADAVNGWFSSLVVVNGNPAISYWDRGNDDLKYVRASDANGTAWNTALTLDSTGGVGFYTSLAIVDGNPAISYTDSTNAALKYIRATDISGTAWGTALTVSPMDWATSLRVVNGNPAISFNANSPSRLRYARACDTSGTSWGQCTITLAFSGATSSALEATGLGNVLRVTTSDGAVTASAVTVTVNVTGGTAALDDYNLTGTITVPAGTPHNSLVSIASGITITNDAVAEANETVQLTLSAPSGAVLGAQTTHTHTITNDDVAAATITLAFDAASSAALEATGLGNVLRVTTSDTNPTSASTTVTISVTGGTATVGDYNLTGTINVPAGTPHNSLVSIASGITITDDAVVEPDEIVELTLSAPSGAVLGAQTTHTHTITNDDTSSGGGSGSSGSIGGSSATSTVTNNTNNASLRVLGVGAIGTQNALPNIGDTIGWTFTIENISGRVLSNVVALVTYPDNDMQGVNATSSIGVGGTFRRGSLLVDYPIGSLAVGELVTFNITTKLPNRSGIFTGALTVTVGGVQANENAILSVSTVTQLPSTGESPWWHKWLMLTLLGGILVGGLTTLRLRAR